MITNTKATLYNYYVVNRETQWERTVLDAVLWQSVEGSERVRFGNQESDTVRIAIPKTVSTGKTYLEPKAFKALETKTGYFTLEPESKIVKGEVPVGVDFEDLERLYDNVVDITTVDNVDYGRARMHYWELMAK